MKRTPFLSGDDLEDVRNAHAMGVSLETLTAQLGTTEDALRRLLDLPQIQPEQPLQRSLDWTRWATRLNAAQKRTATSGN